MNKRINKADIQRINTLLNSVTVAEDMLKNAENNGHRSMWAEHGYTASEELAEYGIEASAGSRDYWKRCMKIWNGIAA